MPRSLSAALTLLACDDGVSPSPVEVHLFVEPAQAHALPKSGLRVTAEQRRDFWSDRRLFLGR